MVRTMLTLCKSTGSLFFLFRGVLVPGFSGEPSLLEGPEFNKLGLINMGSALFVIGLV